MYPITSAVKALYDAEQYQVVRITGTDKNGAAISITEANIMQGGFSIDRYSCNGDELEIGTAIASEMMLTLDNRNGQFNGIVFEGTELYVEIGIADWTQANPTVTYMPCGYFTPDEQPRSLSTITLHALDRMAKFDVPYPYPEPWEDGYGNVMEDGRGNTMYFQLSIVMPKTVSGLISTVCTICGVPFTQTISSLPNYNLTIASMPNVQSVFTLRNLIQWCAGIMGTNAWIDWTGSLRFSWYGESTGYVATIANRFDSDLHEDDVTITGVLYKPVSGTDILAGANGYTISLSGNYLIQNYVATALPNIKNAIAGFTYRPFTATVISAPYLWPMDSITFTDSNNVNHTAVLTNVNFTLNGTTVLEGKGKAVQDNNSNQTGITAEQALLVERATESVRTDIDESLTQQEIFNRLTNGGAEQGLLLYDGRVYLNATYIGAGQVSAEHIDATDLHVNSANIDGTISASRISGGTLQVSGSSYWDSTGIHVKMGEIELRTNDMFGFNVGPHGDIAMGTKPDDMSSFSNNECAFQINNWGHVKAADLQVWAANGDGIYEYIGKITGDYTNQRILITGDTTVNGNISGNLPLNTVTASDSTYVSEVSGGYCQFGYMVTFTIQIRTTSALNQAALTNIVTGFPAPRYISSFVVNGNVATDGNPLRRATIDTSGNMSLIGVYNQTEYINISGSYLTT